MVKKRHLLSQMVIDEVSLVDRGANQFGKVLISKRADPDSRPESPIAKHSPDGGDLHVDRPLGDDDEDEKKKRRKKNRGTATDDVKLRKSAVGFHETDTQVRPGAQPMSVNTDDLPDEVVDYIEKAEAYITDLEAKVSKAAETPAPTEETEPVADPIDADDPDAGILKSLEPSQREVVGSILKRAREAEEVAKAERDLRVQREFIEKARASYSHLPMSAEDLGPVLKALADKAPEEAETISELLSKADASLGTSNVFKEFGSSGGSETSVAGRMEAIAKGLQESNPDLTPEAAMAKAYADNPSLYDEYLREGV